VICEQATAVDHLWHSTQRSRAWLSIQDFTSNCRHLNKTMLLLLAVVSD